MKKLIRFFSISLVYLGVLNACGGSSGPPPPPPVTELTWDQGDWDELNWQ